MSVRGRENGTGKVMGTSERVCVSSVYVLCVILATDRKGMSPVDEGLHTMKYYLSPLQPSGSVRTIRSSETTSPR